MSTKYIIGIDEAGRGSWAGPLVAAAVRVTSDWVQGEICDSKQLTAIGRKRGLVYIKQTVISIGIGWVNPREIDKIGLTKSTNLAMNLALSQVYVNSSLIIIDGNYNYLPQVKSVQTQIKADQLIPAVSAASVVAKNFRDNFMVKVHYKYDKYGFDRHFGYGTKQHRLALARHGTCPLHRQSYKPISLISNK